MKDDNYLRAKKANSTYLRKDEAIKTPTRCSQPTNHEDSCQFDEFESDEKVPYSKSCQKYNTEKMLRMHSSTVNTNIFGKAESDTIKGLIAPPPAFPSKKVNGYEQFIPNNDLLNKQKHTDFNKVLAMLYISEIEAKELKEKYKELLNKSIETEETLNNYKKENQGLKAKLYKQNSWIRTQISHNHNLKNVFQNTKCLLENYDNKIRKIFIEFNEMILYIKKEFQKRFEEAACECNCDSILRKIEEKLVTINNSAIAMKKQSVIDIFENLIFEDNQFSTKPNRIKKNPIKIQNNKLYHDMIIKIKELQDELEFEKKWKKLYTESLAFNNPQGKLSKQLPNQMHKSPEITNSSSHANNCDTNDIFKKYLSEPKEPQSNNLPRTK